MLEDIYKESTATIKLHKVNYEYQYRKESDKVIWRILFYVEILLVRKCYECFHKVINLVKRSHLFVTFTRKLQTY